MLGKLIPAGTLAHEEPETVLRAGIHVVADHTESPDMAQAAIDALLDF